MMDSRTSTLMSNFLRTQQAHFLDNDELWSFLLNNSHLQTCFSIFFLNIRSMAANFTQLLAFLDSTKIKASVYGFVETWLDSRTCDLFNLPGYTCVSSCRDNRRGGGVALQLHESISYVPLTDHSIVEDCIESVFVDVTAIPGSKSKPIIGVIYRPPDTSTDSFLDKFLSILQSLPSGRPCYIMGDFNINLLHYGTANHVNKFLDLMYSNSFFPLNDKPTRVTPTSETLIDNIFYNTFQHSLITTVLCTDISDHFPLLSFNESFSTTLNSTSSFQSRSINQANTLLFLERLSLVRWTDVLESDDPDLAMNMFMQQIIDVYNNSFPLVTKSKKGGCQPWLNDDLKSLISTKNKLYKKFKKRPSVFNEINFKTARSLTARRITEARKSYYQSLLHLHKGNLKHIWKVLKQAMGMPNINSQCNSVMVNDELITSPLSIANNFNQFFATVGCNLARSIPPTAEEAVSFLSGDFPNSFFLSPVTEAELLICVHALKSNSSGHDGICSSVVKSACELLVTPLLHIINLSFSSGIVPSHVKIANVTPIFKKGDPLSIGNYRPISMLSVFSKIIEKLMYKRLYNYLSSNNILYNKQFGFREGFSTEMALITSLDYITKALDDREHVLALFLDLRKAFDMVNFNILFSKLAHYGVRGNALSWFRNYLENRSQRVRIQSAFSDDRLVTCGVPQGSTLGPLLFLIYINDLPNCFTCDGINSVLFADDTSLFLKGKDIETLTSEFNANIARLFLWLNTNKLSLNLEKTYSMLFSLSPVTRSLPLNLSINDFPIQRVHLIRFLGVIVDDKLTFSQHIHHISNKISKSIGILNKVKRVLNEESLLMLYNSLIHSYLHYCNLIWGHASRTSLNSLLLLQKKALRIISLSPYYAHTAPLYSHYKITHLLDLHKLLSSVFIFRCINGLFPASFLNLFNPFAHLNTPDPQSILTRHSAVPHYPVPFARTLLRQKFILITAVKLFHEFIVPLNLLITHPTLSRFKKAIKKCIIVME